jgi:hypothetical protein
MAHDTSLRPLRSDDSYSRDPAPPGRANDPLAELARLIGQEDPFASTRPQSRASAPPPAAQPYNEHGNHPDWATRPGAHQEPAYRDPTADSDDYEADRHAEGHYQRAPHYGQQPQEPHYEQQAYDQQAYAADGYDEDRPYTDEGYDEPRPEKRRGGLMTIAAVVGVVVIGVAGVFGYRAISGHASTGGEPPVIKAETAPLKTPAAPSNDGQVKQQYDRVGTSGGERTVSREEQPVDPRQMVRGPAPSGATPPGATGSVLPPLPAPTQSPVAAGSEPKKVKTVAIRPEVPPSPTQAVPPLRPATPAVTGTVTATAPPAPTPVRPAPTPAPAAPTRSLNADSGNYVVQVASQKSETDALASFKALQQKYPSVLASYQALVKRADLGERGVYYRAQVGPFSTREEAIEMCSNLKNAGGQCIVQSN